MIYNTMSSNTTVIFMETVPWFLRVYFSSLSIENDGKEIKPCKYSNRSDGSSLISSMGHMFFIHILVATYFPFFMQVCYCRVPRVCFQIVLTSHLIMRSAATIRIL